MNYHVNRDATSRFNDIFELKRYAASLAWEKDFPRTTTTDDDRWGVAYQRYSSRQRGGGFGRLPTGADANSDHVEDQKFYTLGFEDAAAARLRTLGRRAQRSPAAFRSITPTRRGRIAAAYTAERSRRHPPQRQRSRDLYAPFFVENRFHWGALSITPGVRIENIWQGVRNTATSTRPPPARRSPMIQLQRLRAALRPRDFLRGGAKGRALRATSRNRIGRKFSPRPSRPAARRSSRTTSRKVHAVAVRGRPSRHAGLWLTWDVSGFLLDFDDQIGTVALPGGLSTLANVGRAQHFGARSSPASWM